MFAAKNYKFTNLIKILQLWSLFDTDYKTYHCLEGYLYDLQHVNDHERGDLFDLEGK